MKFVTRSSLLFFAAFALVGASVANAQIEAETLAILLILIVLAPVESLDRILESLYAAAGQVRSIFVRRHLLGPGIKLAAVLVVMWRGGDVRTLAVLYVLAGILGLGFYLSCWRKMFSLFRSGETEQPLRVEMPFREIFSYSLPLYSSQIGFVMRSSLVVLLLQWYVDSVAVAEFRAVFPFARLNEVVMGSFAIMFVPVASRLFARQETDGINDLYWRSSTWILVLSLPVFLLTGVFAPWFTPLVLGEGYAASSWILCLLTSAFFIDAIFGFNLHTLRVYAKVWHIAIIELAAIVCCLGLCLALVPRHGAWGAAIAISLATVTQNVIAQWVMRRTTGVGRITWKYAKFYLSAGAMVIAIVGTQWVLDPPIVVTASLAAIAYCALVWTHRPILRVDDTFPELRKIPLVSRWFSVPSPSELGTLMEGGR